MSRFHLGSFAVLTGLGLAVLVLSHEIVYLVGHGPGPGYEQAMRDGGHDGYWSPYVVAVTVIIAGLGAVAAIQVLYLGRLAARVDPTAVLGIDAAARSFGGELRSLWIRLSVFATLAFMVQENVELAGTGIEPPGLAILAGHDGLAIPIILVVSSIVAAIGALVRWRRAILIWRIEAARHRRTHRATSARPIVAPMRAPSQIVGRRNGVRGPPPVHSRAA